MKLFCNMKLPYILLIGLASLAMVSCDDFLDKYPDDRADVDSPDKVQSLLTSAYSTYSPDFMLEMTSDNVSDNGRDYMCQQNQQQLYRFEQVETSGQDDPTNFWQGQYKAIAVANEALGALDALEETSMSNAYRAEAKLCRAYAVFRLANTFCMSYDEATADSCLGIPYPLKSGEEMKTRGTLRETYDLMEKDIEEALATMDDSYMTVPKYRFNEKAAYAFAARFHLFRHHYEKAIQYANQALGGNVSGVLRNMESYSSLAPEDFGNAYVSSSEPANLMLQTAYSLNGRASYYTLFWRYTTNYNVNYYEVFWAHMPWSSTQGSSGNTLYEAHRVYGAEYFVYVPKMMEFFEVLDKVNQTGLAHIVDAVFTTDETLLVRAEAYALTGEYQKAVDDINAWMGAHCAGKYDSYTLPTMTVASINSFYNALSYVPVEITDDSQRGIKKKLHPQGFTILAEAENILHMILQIRRIETWHTGARMIDIKRYGIEYSHVQDGEPTLIFKAGDLRGALQLPIDVISAGLEANPR